MIGKFTDRFIRVRLRRDERLMSIVIAAIVAALFLLLGNMVYVNYLLMRNLTKSETAHSTPTVQTAIISPTSAPSPTLLPIKKAESYAKTPVASSNPQDYYIPLGSGSSQATDWADVPGAQVVLDFGQYKHIKEVHFEASIYLPNAEESVWVRLFNVTDMHVVWNSDVLMNQGSTALLISNPVSVDLGSKLYQVQMKTQLGATANLVQSRIHIITQ